MRAVNTSLGKTAAKSLGLPSPVRLQRRQRVGQPFLSGNALIGAAPGGKAVAALGHILTTSEAHLQHASGTDSLADSGLAGQQFQPLNLTSDVHDRFSALVFDATGIENTDQLRALYDFFHPTIRKLGTNGRILVVGLDPKICKATAQAAAQRALEGFVRSLAKEVGNKGATANLIWMAPTSAKQLDSSVRFFLSARSAYVSGQNVRLGRSRLTAQPERMDLPLEGKFALVTGASRGIGAAIAETLATDGATVIVLDLPATMATLQTVANRVKGHALPCDITDEEAPEKILNFVRKHFPGLDLIIHNAGITRDKTLGNMPEHFWDITLAVNLTAEERINEALLEQEIIRDNGRIVCVSSISGIAGNFGQANYATAKCGVIGYVEALAPKLTNNITINAVAPGFIETAMTDAMPLALREAGRRMNSLSQGGLPVDVAETTAWYCHPASTAINGTTVRVCGQSLIGR